MLGGSLTPVYLFPSSLPLDYVGVTQLSHLPNPPPPTPHIIPKKKLTEHVYDRLDPLRRDGGGAPTTNLPKPL